MKIVSHGLLLLLLLQLLGCVSYPPIQYPDVVAPQTVTIEPVWRAERPVVALVLGSGGDRGFAHVGVVKVLEESGIAIDVVAGASAGSVVGALYAGGYGGAELERLAFELDQRQLNDFELSKRGYVRGEQLQDFINRALENRSIEQLDKPFAVVATRLGSGEVAVFNRGNTGLAVRASSSIPGVFNPARIGGVEYVDGDLKQPVPVNVAREMGAELVIAVDISPRPADYPQPQDIIDMLNQSLRIMRLSIAAHELEKAQVVIRPVIGQTPDIDEAAKRRLIQSGEEAARAALPQIREWLDRLTAEKSSKRRGK